MSKQNYPEGASSQTYEQWAGFAATDRAEALAHQTDVAASKVCEAIRAINQIDLTPAVVAQIISTLQVRVQSSNWAHTDAGSGVDDSLTDAYVCASEVSE